MLVILQRIAFLFPVHYPDLVSYPSHQCSPFATLARLFFHLQSSHLFISVTITTTNVLTDLLALQWEAKPPRERTRESQNHPPKSLAPISVQYTMPPDHARCFITGTTILWIIHSFVCWTPLPDGLFRLNCRGCEADAAILNRSVVVCCGYA